MHVSKLAVLALATCATIAGAQTIPASEAAKHIGERQTVCGNIAGEHTAASSHGAPTFVNLDKPYPHQIFTVLIWGDDKSSVGDFPANGQVCVTGTIKSFRGIPEIELRDSHGWSVPK